MNATNKSQVDKHSKNTTPVTVIGLGPMGQALARAFIQAGHPTTVWNRTAEKATSLVHQGATLANTVTDAVTASPLVIICVLNYDVVHKILKPASHLLEGRTLVNLTSDSPSRAREAAIWASKHKIDYLDGAIMTPTTTIGKPTAKILYSGKEAAYQTHQTTLADLGGTATFLGTDPGRAAAFDVALLDLFWTSMSGYIHALAVAKSENISAKELVPHTHGIVDILPDIMTYLADQVDARNYHGEQSNIISAKAGIEHIIHSAQTHGIDVSVLSAAKEIAQKAIEEGHGNDGFSRLIEVIRRS